MLRVSVPTPSNSPAPKDRDASTSGGESVVARRFISMPDESGNYNPPSPPYQAYYYPQVEGAKLSKVGIGICLIVKSQYDTFNGIGKRLYRFPPNSIGVPDAYCQ